MLFPSFVLLSFDFAAVRSRGYQIQDAVMSSRQRPPVPQNRSCVLHQQHLTQPPQPANTTLTTSPLSLSKDLFDTTLSINLSGAFYTTQSAARAMASQSPPGGSIIGISSISALVGGGLQTHYTPTKAGVLSLMQSCAVALGKYGIRCNALLPGTIRTQLNDQDLKDHGKKRYMEGRIPLGRIGETGDLGGPAVFLGCEELSGYVVSLRRLLKCERGSRADSILQTGAQLLVDGGLFVNLQ